MENSIPDIEKRKFMLRAIWWCVFVLASGLLAEGIAQVIIFISSSPTLHHSFIDGEVICGFALSLTGGVLVDDIFKSIEAKSGIKTSAILAFAFATFFAAMSKCGMNLNKNNFFICSVIILFISLIITWSIKYSFYCSEYNEKQ